MRNDIKSCISIFLICVVLLTVLMFTVGCGSSGDSEAAGATKHPIVKTWAYAASEYCYISYGFGEGGTATLLAYCNDIGTHFNMQAMRGTYEILDADSLSVTWTRSSCGGSSFSTVYTFSVVGNQLSLLKEGGSQVIVMVDSSTVPQYEGNALITTGCYDENDNFTAQPVVDLG